jgi:hypothetical protein
MASAARMRPLASSWSSALDTPAAGAGIAVAAGPGITAAGAPGMAAAGPGGITGPPAGSG